MSIATFGDDESTVKNDNPEIEDLVSRTRGGDRQAGETLFRRYGGAALRCGLGMTGGRRADAEDLVQDAFVKCLTTLDDLREPTHFGGWLLRTVRNLGVNRFHANGARVRAHERTGERTNGSPPPSDPFERFATNQRRAMVREVFSRLPESPMKEAARLYYLDEVGATEEVAVRLGVPKSTITTRLDRFRDALRKEMIVHIARNIRPGAERHDAQEVLS